MIPIPVTNIQLDNEKRQRLYEQMRNFKLTCQTYGVPCFISCVVANNDEGTEYMRECYDAASHKIRLSNDQISRHMLISNGARAVIPRAITIQDEPEWDDVLDE